MSEPYRVVIVDDEMISRGFMELLIKPSKHYEVIAALPFAKDALLWCQQHTPPDLIIMDVMMEQGIHIRLNRMGAGSVLPRSPFQKALVNQCIPD